MSEKKITVEQAEKLLRATLETIAESVDDYPPGSFGQMLADNGVCPECHKGGLVIHEIARRDGGWIKASMRCTGCDWESPGGWSD